MNIDNPNFFAILPATVRYDPRLTPRSVLLYALLTSLACAGGEAYASNEYLMRVLEVSERTVMRLLRELVDTDYIAIRYEYKGDTLEIARRLIRIKELPLLLDMPKTQALYAVIPTHVLCNGELSPQSKLLYAEISAATPTDGYCTKPATFFAELLHTSEDSVRRWIRELAAVDALRVEMEYKGDTREVCRRRIYLTAAADIVEKRRQIAAERPKAGESGKEPTAPKVANTPENTQILGVCNFVTPYIYGKNRRRARHGRRRKNTEKLRL